MKDSALLAELRRVHGERFSLSPDVCRKLCFPQEGPVPHRHIVGMNKMAKVRL